MMESCINFQNLGKLLELALCGKTRKIRGLEVA